MRQKTQVLLLYDKSLKKLPLWGTISMFSQFSQSRNTLLLNNCFFFCESCNNWSDFCFRCWEAWHQIFSPQWELHNIAWLEFCVLISPWPKSFPSILSHQVLCVCVCVCVCIVHVCSSQKHLWSAAKMNQWINKQIISARLQV